MFRIEKSDASLEPNIEKIREVGIYVDKSRICLHKTGYVAHISSRKCLHNPIGNIIIVGRISYYCI